MGGPLPARRRLFHVPFLIRNSADAVQKTNLVGLAFEESFRVDGSHAAGARSSDRLAVNVILYIAASEDARHVGLRTIVRQM